MALSTFGAIMGFAVKMAGESLEAYRKALPEVKDPALREALEALAREGEKNRALMEQARRENVTEMILEPVTGLLSEDYDIDASVPAGSKDADFLKAALAHEAREEKFFREASARIPLPEVARIFRKVAAKKEKNRAVLSAVKLG